jgi:hypothetical protein
VLGLFKNPAELNRAMHQDYRDALQQEGNYHWEKYKIPSPLGPQFSTEGQRKAWSPEEIKNARAQVATRWTGYEKYFPNFVEKGFTDVPAAPEAKPGAAPSAQQGDVSVDSIRSRLREKLPKAK